MHTDDGKRLHLTSLNPWHYGPYVPLVGNVQNASGVTPEELKRAVVRGMRMWQQASGHAFGFDYWQGGDARVYQVGMKRDGLSTIFFASADPARGGLTPNQSAFTRVYFDPESGAIDEVDIVLNDVDMSFTAAPRAGNYAGAAPRPVIVLEDVIAHELGHVLGLGHSGVLDATMFPFGWAGQAELSCDDARAVRALFGTQRDRGALSGRVLDPSGRPILGAHVVAIDLGRSSVAASAITSRDGSYRIDGLEGGDYALMIEPFMPGPVALDDVYADANLSGSCPSGLFSRTFHGSHGKLTVVELDGRGTLRLDDVLVTCDGVSPLAAADEDPEGMPELRFDERGILAAVVLGSPNAADVFALDTTGGPLALSFVSYSLFSPAQVLPTIERTSTATLAPLASETPSALAPPGDARLSLDWLPAGRHVLSLATSLAAPNSYPMGSTYLDEQPFVLIVGRQGNASTPDDCWGPEPSTDYASPEGPPRRITVPDESGLAIDCGVSAPGLPSEGDGRWATLAAFATAFALRRLGVRRREAHRAPGGFKTAR